MLKYVNGDIFESRCEALVNPVNCVGVAGAGLALEFKKRYPENHAAYCNYCKHGYMKPGRVFVFVTDTKKNPHLIINFPTKLHWRNKSRVFPDIHMGLWNLVDHLFEYQIYSIAIPALGCGKGGLTWHSVKCKMDQILRPFAHGLRILIYEPH